MIPRFVHRGLLRIAFRIRNRWRRIRKVPLEGVAMVARDLEGRVLLVRHSYGPSGWFLPGGGIRRGESARDAASRELREETNCGCDRVFEVGSMEETISGSPHTTYLFTCVTHDLPVPDRRETVDVRFFATHSLPEPLSGRTRARIEFWKTQASPPAG